MLKFSAFSPLYGEGKSIFAFQQRQVSGISRCNYLCVQVMGLLSGRRGMAVAPLGFWKRQHCSSCHGSGTQWSHSFELTGSFKERKYCFSANVPNKEAICIFNQWITWELWWYCKATSFSLSLFLSSSSAVPHTYTPTRMNTHTTVLSLRTF